MENKQMKKKPRRRVAQKSVPARRIGPWFRCPRCEARNVVFRTREANYICRRCGEVFTVDWEAKRCIPVDETGGGV